MRTGKFFFFVILFFSSIPRQAKPYQSVGILLQNLVLNGCILSDGLEVSGCMFNYHLIKTGLRSSLFLYALRFASSRVSLA